MSKRCDNCGHWDDDGTGPHFGFCRFDPPQLLPAVLAELLKRDRDLTPRGAADDYAVWGCPVTCCDDWCSRHQPKGDAGR